MSILTELLRKKITWDQAKTKIETWISQVSSGLPATAQAALGEVLTDAKQAASDAITLADTMAGPLLADGADAVEAAFDVAAKAYLGPLGTLITPAVHDSIDRIRDGLKAAIDAKALQLKATLMPATTGAPAK